LQFVHASLEEEYQRWLKLVGDDHNPGGVGVVRVQDVLRAHFLIADFFMEEERGIGGVGPRDLNLLHSAVARQSVAHGHTEKWREPLQKCATLLFGLVKDHPFHDANKRTAFLVALFQLDSLGRTPRVSHKEFEDFIVDIADNRLVRFARYRDMTGQPDADVLFIHDFLKRNTREIDKRPYTVTFHELAQILKKFGFELVNPSDNYINLVRIDHVGGFLGLGKKRRRETWLAKIGFPGWKKQVSRGALGKVRSAAGLTAERGYDSKVFFENADSLTALISMYEAPLKRLANR
jgi:death-on-curing family protein